MPGGNTSAFLDDFIFNQAPGRIRRVEELGRSQQAENERRFASARTFGQDVFNRNTGRTFTDERFNQIFAAEGSRATGDFLADADLLNESLGIRGVGGGVAAQQAGNLRANFLNNLAQVKGNLRLAQIQSDFADSQRNLSAGADFRNFLATPVDETELATTAAAFQGFSELGGILASREAGQDQAKAIKDASEPNFLDYASTFLPVLGLFG